MDGSRSALGLRCGNNTAMEPYRAFIEHIEPAQQPTGFKLKVSSLVLGKLWQMFHYSFSVSFVGTTGNYQLGFFASFFLGAVCSIGSVWWSSYTTKKSAY
jgi:maltose/moltooligosaccharide transporter